MSNTRQAGHYWVKLDDPVSPDWHVAQWHDNNGDGSDWCWHSHYLNGKAYDGGFSEINETRIPSPDEWVLMNSFTNLSDVNPITEVTKWASLSDGTTMTLTVKKQHR